MQAAAQSAKRIAIVALGVCIVIDRDNRNTLPVEDMQRISVKEHAV
jgi:hypothetical protein